MSARAKARALLASSLDVDRSGVAPLAIETLIGAGGRSNATITLRLVGARWQALPELALMLAALVAPQIGRGFALPYVEGGDVIIEGGTAHAAIDLRARLAAAGLVGKLMRAIAIAREDIS
mgnify:FL=1